MKGKQLLILLVLAALAGAGWYYLSERTRQSWSGSGRGGDKILAFPINDVAHVRVKNTDGELNLVKKGDTWVVPERADYPANFDEVSGLLRKLWELKTVQEVKVGPSQMARLELEDPGKDKPGTIVELMGADGKTFTTLLLGKKYARKSEGGGGDLGMPGFAIGRYVKPLGGLKVSLVSDPFEDVEPKPEKWLAKDFIKIESPKSIAVVGPTDAQKWTVSRESAAGEWKLADAKPDEKVDANKTFGLNTLFSSASFDDVLAADTKPEETGLDKPTVAKIETFDGFDYDLKIGKSNGKSTPVAVSISAKFQKERPPAKDEKAEDKVKLDEAFQAKQKQLAEKLAREQQQVGSRIYLVSNSTVESLVKDRASLLPDKPSPSDPASAPGGPNPLNGAMPFPGLTPPPTPAPEPTPQPAAEPAEKLSPAPMPAPPPAPAPPAPPVKPGADVPAPPAPQPPPPASVPDANPAPKLPSEPPPAPDSKPAPKPAAEPAPEVPPKP